MSESGTVYVIKDWGRIYENSRSRYVEELRWVAIPNKHDSFGFRTLIGRPNGLALYGAWCLIIQVASKCSPRGTLVSKSGVPLTAKTISMLTGAPEDGIQECLDAVQLPEIGWLTAKVSGGYQAGDSRVIDGYQEGDERVIEGYQVPDTLTRARGRSIPFSPIPSSSVEKGGSGGKETPNGLPPSQRFAEVWDRWPRKVYQADAERDWKRLVTVESESAVFECLESFLGSRQNQREIVPNLGSVNGKAGWLANCAKDGWKSRWPKRKETRAEAIQRALEQG